jgi:hypothetical protein
MAVETEKPGVWSWLTLTLVALLAAAPLWGPGIVNTRGGGDSPFLLQRAHQLVINLQSGVFPVRWMPDAAYGLGYPFFSYYAALPYYLVGLLALAGLDLLTALKMVQTLGFIAAALAMHSWMFRLTRNRWAAWLAAVAYTVAPFHLVNVYVRGDSLSEFTAFVFYPLVLRGLDEISTPGDGGTARWWWPALAYAGLVLSHIISAMIFSPFALLYVVMLAWRDKGQRWRGLKIGLWAVGCGLLLSAWYWLPAVAELGYVQLGPSTQDYFHYSRHFRTHNLVQDTLLFDYSTTAGHVVRSPFAMGLVQAVLAALGGLVSLVKGIRRQLKAAWCFVLFGLLTSTAMITPLSKPLWDHLPVLPVTQFPWRFLSVQALFAAAVTAALMSDRRATPSSGWIALPVAVLATASTLLSLHPDRLPVGPSDVTAERLRLYELFAGNIGTTIRHEWLPNTANPRPFTSDALIEPGASPRAIPLDGASLEAALVQRRPIRQTWRVWGEGGRIAFPLLHWPGWTARLDGQPIDVWPVEGSGYLALEAPPGEHTVVLQLSRTPLRAAAEAMSLCALVGLVVALVRARPKVRWSVVAQHLAIVVLPTLVLLLLPRGDLDSQNDLTMDFIHMPYLHHNPGGVHLDSAARLTGYTLSAEELAPGDTLTITLDGSHTDDAYTATVRLVSPAAVRYDVEPLVETSAGLRSSTSIALQMPEDISRGVYLLQLHVSGPEGKLRARTPRGNGLGILYLQPVRIPRGPPLPPDASVLAPFGPAIRLHAVTVSQSAPDRLAVRLAWSTMRPVAANYGISLRLLDADGQQRVSLDTQPGYGFLPTSLWRPGELVTDRYVLALPDDLPPGADFFLQIVLYQVPTLEPIGQVRVGSFPLPMEMDDSFEAYRSPRAFTLPPLHNPVEVNFGEEVRLAGYDLEQGEDALHLTLWWQALHPPQADYTVFVHLFEPATASPSIQSDAQPRGGTYPTSWWAEGEVISDTVTLPLANVPAGTYQLAVGLYDHTLTRLRAVASDGQQVPDDRVVLPIDVRIGQ